MHQLRSMPIVIRWVLACFVLSLSSAIAAPFTGQQSMELVCSMNGGMKLLLKDSQGEVESGYTVLDCPLCQSPLAPPPPLAPAPSLLDSSLAYAMQSIPAARMAALVAPPMPARGPPTFSA